MGESLTEQRRVRDDGLRVVKRFSLGREWTVPVEEAPANYVPAAAVIRRGERCPELLGVKRVQAAWKVRCESSRLNWESALQTGRLGGQEREMEFPV